MTLFRIFGLSIHAYGLMLAIAFLVAIFAIAKVGKPLGIEFDTIIDLATWVIIGAVIGARIAYVLTNLPYFLSSPWWEVFMVSSGGLAFHGGLIGGFGAGFWFVKRRGIYPWRLADLVAPFIALGYSIVRIGCFLNHCCYGKVSNLPWALPCGPDLAARHPTQLYSFLGSLILFGILWRFRNHKQFPGFLFLLYLGLYSIMRFIVEIFREGPMIFPWLTEAQLVCIILGGAAFGLIGWFRRGAQNGRPGTDATADLHR
ncbi:MAG TPA: prolipoprotein diacylglyceryl transferase [Bacillota bacterium]